MNEFGSSFCVMNLDRMAGFGNCVDIWSVGYVVDIQYIPMLLLYQNIEISVCSLHA